MQLLRALAAAAAAVAAAAAPPAAPPGDVTWLSPTPFDNASHADGMPAGNGRVVVLAWGDPAAGGLSFYVRSPLAQHTDSTLYTIARMTVAVSPNPFSAGAYYNQTHTLRDGSITVYGGGSGHADFSAVLQLYVDANSDTVVVTAAARDGAPPLSLAVTVASVRPAARFSYGPLDFQCSPASSGPDVLVGAGTSLPPAAIAIYHRNDVGAGDTSLFNSSMRLQGLTSLLGAFADPLDGRIFGLGVVGAAGAAGDGAALVRTSLTTLASAAPAVSFVVRVAVRVDPLAHGDEAGWLAALAGALSGGPSPSSRKAASDAWWAAFWARSYIALPDEPSPPPKVGVFACDGGAAQRVTVAPASGEVTLAGGACLVPSADGTVVTAGACGPATHWFVTPCTAAGCDPAAEWWVRNNATRKVLGLPGAVCPWLDVWTADDPTGSQKNELWALNATDGTLRTLCLACPARCVTVVPQPSAAAAAAAAAPVPSVLAAQYARTRFVQAVQSRGVDVPIKFNGMLFTSMVGEGGPRDVDYRQWGPDHWWQNTRLPYGAQLAAGDFDTMRVVLDWLAGMAPLLRARSRALLGFDSVFATETVNAFGLYQGYEYGCAAATERPPGYPVWLEGPGDEGGWVRYDFGGNGVFLEGGLMAVDYCMRSNDADACARYVPLATLALDFYISHYTNTTADGKFLLWPTQVLESYWCAWPGWTNCCENDLPQLAGLWGLSGAVLGLPPAYVAPDQRARYAALRASLPALPVTADGARYVPAWVTSSGSHNSEVPELFGSHPFRLDTVGRAAVDPAVNLTVGVATWRALPLAQANTGWYYGILDAAFLGLADEAYAMAADRAVQPPPTGYRYPAFAQHYQDYEPSADHFANMQTAVQLMLLQSGEDGAAGTIVLLPAWPCARDVSFKLWAPKNTTVEVVYRNGSLVSLDVQPPARAGAVRWANCVVA